MYICVCVMAKIRMARTVLESEVHKSKCNYDSRGLALTSFLLLCLLQELTFQ